MYFISSKSGSDQVWRQSVAGGAATQVTNYPLDVGSYKLSPDGKSLALSFDVFADCKDLACTKMHHDDDRGKQGQRQDLRQAVHPPLGHMGGWDAQPVVHRCDRR